MTFQYDKDWLTRPEPTPLSRSLPPREEIFTQKDCRAFFGGTLPEEGNRKVIARILGISDKNDFAMLEQIGGECAGAVEDIDYLLAQRYDRIQDNEGNIQRLHQEDFCQALGIPSEIKYQSEGGPSLADCFALIRDASSAPALDLIALLDAVIFNLLIGNHDAHAKNFSLLYRLDRSIRLAPLYDLVCTVYYPELTDRMAMKIAERCNDYRSWFSKK
jgi:serine/threonine-protein kinase HipA